MKPFIYRGKLFDNDNKAGMIVPLIVMVAAAVFFAVIFINCINAYSGFDIGYGDLICEELTFEKVRIIERGDDGDRYEV